MSPMFIKLSLVATTAWLFMVVILPHSLFELALLFVIVIVSVFGVIYFSLFVLMNSSKVTVVAQSPLDLVALVAPQKRCFV